MARSAINVIHQDDSSRDRCVFQPSVFFLRTGGKRAGILWSMRL